MHETQRDFEYFKSMYPAAIKGYQAKVEAVCDRMEYEGSPMYDEYPDRVMLDRICRQICQDIERESAAAQNPLSVEEFERVETYELGKAIRRQRQMCIRDRKRSRFSRRDERGSRYAGGTRLL